MFQTREKSHLCQNDEKFFRSNLYRSVEIIDPNNDQYFTLTYSELPAITKITPTNYVLEILQ